MVYVVFEQNQNQNHSYVEMYIAALTEKEAETICKDNNKINKEEGVDVYYYFEPVQISKRSVPRET